MGDFGVFLSTLAIFLQDIYQEIITFVLLSFVSDFAFLNKNNLGGIKNPVLFLYGPKDRKAFVWMGKMLSNMLPKSKFVIIKDRKHSWFLHRIDESGILSEIEEFLYNHR